MSVNVIGNLGDPSKDAQALEPILDELELKAVDAVVERIIPALEASFISKILPALQAAGTNGLDGLTATITITFSKKEKS